MDEDSEETCDLDFDETVRFLTAVGDPQRIGLIFALAKQGATRAGDVEATTKLSRPAISHHLKILRDAGVARAERQGKEVFYRLNTPYMTGMLRQLLAAVEACTEDESTTDDTKGTTT